MDRDFLAYLLDSDDPTVDFNNSFVGVDALELILQVLKVKGRIKIINCGEVANLIELGSQLRETK